MKLGHECLPCLLCQARNALDQIALSEKRKTDILKKTSLFLYETFSLSCVSTDLGTALQRFIMAEAKRKDPYRKIKEESNRMAERIFRKTGPLSFRRAIMASIAGNLIDYSLDEVCHDMRKDFLRVAGERLTVDHSRALKKEIEKSERILYLTDNCGEIIFDKFLLAHMRQKKVFIAAKAGPYANDALVADLRRWGLGEYGKIVSTGSSYLGLKESPKEFFSLFSSSLVVAKGMGWWEYLSEGSHPNVFHLFRVKCSRVARELSIPKGSNVCMRNDKP